VDADDAVSRQLASARHALDDALPRIVERLVEMGARLVVLFGSEARGERNPLADLDLLVVIDSDEPFVARTARLYRELDVRVPADIVAYTPAEFERMRETPFVSRALAEGKVLYAA
jgi:predicted nucleotidyltransferase